jgi:predicted acetyltransferase
MVELRNLTAADEDPFRRAYDSTAPAAPNFAPGFAKSPSFAAYLARLADEARGVGLPEGYVPVTTYWGFADEEVVGRLALRHHLSEPLRRIGGHIGYVVLPARRGGGLATEMLRRALPLAKERGIDRVLLTCDEANLASIRVIEKCGGVLEDTATVPETGRIHCRYWIALR